VKGSAVSGGGKSGHLFDPKTGERRKDHSSKGFNHRERLGGKAERLALYKMGSEAMFRKREHSQLFIAHAGTVGRFIRRGRYSSATRGRETAEDRRSGAASRLGTTSSVIGQKAGWLGEKMKRVRRTRT